MNRSIIIVFILLLSPMSMFGQSKDLTSLLSDLNNAVGEEQKASLQFQIGSIYYNKAIYQRAIDYFQETYPYYQKVNDVSRMRIILRQLAQSHQELQAFPQAADYFEKLLPFEDDAQKIALLLKLSWLAEKTQRRDQALAFSQQALELAKKSNDLANVSTIQNNIGYHMMQDGNYEEASKYFNLALSTHRSLKANADPNQKARILLNLGTINALKGDYRHAREEYRKSLVLEEKQKNYDKIANVNNYIAVSYLKSGKREIALSFAEKAKALAEANQAQQVLLDSYRILARIYKEKNNLQEFQKYSQLQQKLQETLNKQQQAKGKQLLEDQLLAEREENELKILLAEKARQVAKAREALLEKDKKEKELTLKNQELELAKQKQKVQEEQLKRQQQQQELISQQLRLAEQKTLAERRQKEIEIQRQETEKQRLLAEKFDTERLKKEKELEAAAKEKELQEQKLQQEKSRKNFTYWLLGLAVIIVVLMFFVVYNAQRSRKAVHRRNVRIQQINEEIQVQNEELLQTQEELQAQRDFVDAQNKELGYKNSMINSSLNYAQKIQEAILPFDTRFNNHFSDHFILYQPRDLVSGDFYWLEHVNDNIIIAMVDCTGHGVPGAFMSMIGYTLLSEIVVTKQMTSPTQILENMHRMIYRALKQDLSKNNDGMDMSVCIIREHDKKMEVRFAGAKLPLYYIENEELKIIKGTRRSLGGNSITSKAFEEHRLHLSKGTKLYLFTDGLQDQHNKALKKFGSKQVKRILSEHHQKPMKAQHQLLLDALQKHQGDEKQRDDISFIGIKL
ncbi:MAG: SpoIIE family protein phosphatase [Flammeovirgaceae bacterium]